MGEAPEAAEVGHVGRTYEDSVPWWPEPARPPRGSPNVVVMVLDDVGFGSLGCYGSEIATPAMDSIAQRGVRYTNFHVTPLCSPTRASLLTGRNHHAVGMSLLSNADSGFPGKRGCISHSAVTVAEVLRDVGYNTAAFGKWHVAPIDQTTAVGPYDQWPLGRGFEQYYGFLEGLTDQYHPELVRDNHRVDPPASPEDGYHLSADIVDRACDFISDQKSIGPDKPFLCYLAFGAGHTPHQAPDEYLARYRGMYDRGWDAIRAERHERQLRMGVVPEGTQLAPRNQGVEPWESLSPDEQRVTARMQEAFAAMLEHTDAQIGRLLAHLDALGIADDTVVMLLSDNGASQEGGAVGVTNTIPYENGDDVSLAYNLAHLDEIGGPWCHSNYPWGWAQAGNTPLKRYKQNTHAGGVRAPLLVSWGKNLVGAAGGVRHQFHHVIDVTPTILDIVGVSMPDHLGGVAQMPVHGVSMRYSFGEPDAPTRRHTQYFEMYGHRAIWHDGWKAVAYHERGTPYDDDVWELYDLAHDFSECHDLAGGRPDVLHELIGRWWAEADRYEVFPLDDRHFAERVALYQSPGSPRSRRSFTLYPGMTRIPGGAAPLINNRSYRIDADVQMAASDSGVLVAQGDVNGGYVLYVADGQLKYEYNHQGTRYRITGSAPIAAGDHVLSYVFDRTGDRTGKGTLLIDGETVGQGSIDSTAKYLIGWQGLTIGRDALSPVSFDYLHEFPFRGMLRTVSYEISDDAPEMVSEIID
ncbi:MAG: arylsulfatase [Nocardioidaceae bacterium]